MLAGERLVVHAHGDHRHPRLVHDPLDRHAGCETVHRPTDQLVGIGLDSGQAEDVAQRHAGPLGVADQVAADLVGHARDRHVLGDDRERHELVVRQLHLPVDHARDLEPPRGAIDGWRDEGRVDAVELVVRDDDRREAGGGKVCRRDARPRRHVRRQGCRRDVRWRGRAALSIQQVPSQGSGHHGPDGDGAARLQEPSAPPIGHRGRDR
jgi:hypothetical protein